MDPIWWLDLTRAAGPRGAWTVEVAGEDETPVVLLTIVGTAGGAWRSDQLHGDKGASFVAALANGSGVKVTNLKGKPLGQISLRGSSATLRYIDDQQGRVGTQSAVIAKGAKPPTMVPAAPAMPVITAQRPVGAATKLSATVQKNLWAKSECAENYDGKDMPELEGEPLAGGAVLVMVPCGAGAYNFNAVPYVLRGAALHVAEFDTPQDVSGEGGTAMLTNHYYDEKTGVLESYAKGRGIGDCGVVEAHVWDGKRFRAIAHNVMEECRGSMNKLSVWTAKVVYK